MSRSVNNWKETLKDKNSYQAAKQLIGDLIGYRSTSLHRADDEDTLNNFIKAILEQPVEPV